MAETSFVYSDWDCVHMRSSLQMGLVLHGSYSSYIDKQVRHSSEKIYHMVIVLLHILETGKLQDLYFRIFQVVCNRCKSTNSF